MARLQSNHNPFHANCPTPHSKLNSISECEATQTLWAILRSCPDQDVELVRMRCTPTLVRGPWPLDDFVPTIRKRYYFWRHALGDQMLLLLEY